MDLQMQAASKASEDDLHLARCRAAGKGSARSSKAEAVHFGESYHMGCAPARAPLTRPMPDASLLWVDHRARFLGSGTAARGTSLRTRPLPGRQPRSGKFAVSRGRGANPR